MSLMCANQGAAKRCGRSHWDRLADAVREIFPRKTALNLADISGLRPRSWEYFLSRKSSVTSDALVALLDTPHGPAILAALMGDSRERWWIEIKLRWDRERVEARLNEIDRQIDDVRAQQ